MHSGVRKRTYALLAAMVVFSSLGNVLLSKGMKQVGEVSEFSPLALLPVFLKTFTNGSIWLGISSLLFFFVSYLLLLSWADLSYVLPVTAIGYVANALMGRLFLHEQITTARWAGTLLIMAGTVLVGVGNPQTGHSQEHSEGQP